MTMNPKLDVFIAGYAPKCTNAKSLVKCIRHFSTYHVNNVQDAHTDAWTQEQPENIMPPTALHWQRHKNDGVYYADIMAQPLQAYQFHTTHVSSSI